MKKNILSLAALLIATVTFTACSNDDNIIAEQPAQPTEQVYTMTVNASKGGDAATTRALSLSGSTLNATWTEGDVVEVWTSDGTTKQYGTLTAKTGGENTTLTGTLTELPSNGETLLLKYLSPAYNTQDGTLTGSDTSIDKVCDYATATVTATVVGDNVTATDVDFVNQQAIVKFTLKDKGNADADAAISPSALTVTDGSSTVSLTNIPNTTYTANGDGVLYIAFPAAGSAKTVTLTATVGDDTYTYTTKADVTFTNGQYYVITVKMTKQGPCPDGSHPHWIDLGLPSGTLWQCCNEGANAPEEYGDYYTFDAAQSYNPPTQAQIQELLDGTTSEWTTLNGVNGRLFTSSKNGGKVFFPAAGLQREGELYVAGSGGHYWSSSLYESGPGYAYGLSFGSGYASLNNYLDYRDYGQSVRPVCQN